MFRQEHPSFLIRLRLLGFCGLDRKRDDLIREFAGGAARFPVRSSRAGSTSISWPPVTRFNWRVDHGIGI